MDVRVVAASNRNVEEEVEAGRFRKDLFYRLNAVSIVLPALRERKETSAPGEELCRARLFPESGSEVFSGGTSLAVIEGRYVEKVLNHTGGNKQAAARILDFDRKTLDRMIKRHKISVERVANFPSRAAYAPFQQSQNQTGVQPGRPK